MILQKDNVVKISDDAYKIARLKDMGFKEVVEEKEFAPIVTNLKDLTVPVLKEMAADKDIEIPSKATKAEIIGLIEGGE